MFPQNTGRLPPGAPRGEPQNIPPQTPTEITALNPPFFNFFFPSSFLCSLGFVLGALAGHVKREGMRRGAVIAFILFLFPPPPPPRWGGR